MASLNDIETKIQSIINILKSRIVKTITGILPLTFTANAGNAVDWSISGNDNVGKNKFETPNISETWYDVKWSVENGVLKGVGTYNDKAAHTRPRLQGRLPAGSYILSGSPDYTITGIRLQIGTCTDSQGTDFATLGYDEGSGFSFTLQADSWVSVRVWTNQSLYQQAIDVSIPIMLRPADTSADFEPYQVGVGQRSANLFELKRICDYNGVTAQSLIAYGVTFTVNGDKIALSNQSTSAYPQIFLNSIYGQNCPKLESGKTYSAKVFVENAPADSTIYIHVKVKNRNDTDWQSGYVVKIETSGTTFTVSQDWDIWGYLFVAQGNNVTYQDTTVRFCLTEGSTAPQTYIPYGYEIPLNVNSSTQDIYIGSEPLTAGHSISKTSTGVDIECFDGENTVSTTLYNKPEMTIKYKYNGGN